MKRRQLRVGLWLLALALIAGCDGGAGSAESSTTEAGDTTTTSAAPQESTTTEAAPPAEPRILRTHATTPVTAWDPYIDGGATARAANYHVWDRLVIREGTEQVGQLAVSWQNIDPLTWEFKLRDDVFFHDGEQLTGEDVSASFDRLLAIADPSTVGNWTTFDRVEVVDDYTIRIITTEPKSDILTALERTVIGPAHLVDDPRFVEVGSGPFKFVEWRSGEVLTLEANPDYWGGAPAIDGIEFLEIPEASSRITALLADDIDIVSGLTPDSIPIVDDDPNSEVLIVPSYSRWVVSFGQYTDKLKDVRVRKALLHAIDRDEMVASLFPDLGTTMRGTMTEIALYYAEQEPYAYDPELARELLAEAGYDESTPLDLRFTFRPGSRILIEEVAALVTSYWQAVGVNVQLEGMDSAGFTAEREDGTAEAQLDLNSGGLGDVASTEALNFYSTSTIWGVNDPEFDAIVDAARAEMDPTQQGERWAEVQRYVWDQLPRLFLVEMKGVFGVRNEVQNFEPSGAVEVPDFRYVTLDG